MSQTATATKPRQEIAPASQAQPPAKEVQPPSLRAQIDALKPEFAKTLPKNIEADAFIRNVQTAIQLNPELATCTPRSLFAACMKAASDGLIIDGREAALVTRNVKVSKNPDKWEKQAIYQPMVQGLMKLARNSGEIAALIAHVVYENDRFHYVLGDDERIEHEPAPFNVEQGNPIAVYAIAKLRDGTVIREVMRAKAVLAIGAQGQNGYQYNPESGKNFAEWWRKTAIRRIVKYVPRSSDAIGKFAEAAEQIDAGFDFDAEPVAPKPAGKKRGGAAAALKDVTPKPEAAEPSKKEAQTKQREAHPNADQDGVLDEGYGDMIHGDDDRGPADDI